MRVSRLRHTITGLTRPDARRSFIAQLQHVEIAMGLLDSILGAAGGAAGGAIGDLLKSQEGGLGGLVAAFEKGGLGDVANSWISKGANLPISAEQIHNVLGSGPVADIAAKLGISPESAAKQLSEMLPGVIDKLTPDGALPKGGLGGLLGGLKL
jgi:uncharacterized protein YidB (DUF937 family)